jgi:hypothetical protein
MDKIDNMQSLEEHIEKIPGFELTLELDTIGDVVKICEMAGVKLPVMQEEYFDNGRAIKKLLDDRRRLTKLCLAMFRILFYGHTDPPAIHEPEVWQILREATGKTIDELL